MGYPFGLAPDAEGDGTTPEGLQRVIWSLYRAQAPLIVRGCEVTGTSSMKWAVAAGVVYIPTGDARAVLVPVDATTVPTSPAPSTGSRTDFLYVGVDGAVRVGASVPAGSALIGKRTVPAGITATTAAPASVLDRGYAMLFGASMGRLLRWVDSTAYRGVLSSSTTAQVVYSGNISLPTDRLLDFRLSQTAASDAKSSFVWEIWLDSTLFFAPEMVVDTIGDTKTYTASEWVLEGTHTISVKRRLAVNGGKPIIHVGGGTERRPGNRFEVVDIGMIW